MIGMKENLIDMLGTVFANRQIEAHARAQKVPAYKREQERYKRAFKILLQQDRGNASILEEAGALLNIITTAEAYYLGMQDGVTIMQLLTQTDLPFSVLEKEAVKKVEASMPQNEPFNLRPFALRSTREEKEAC